MTTESRNPTLGKCHFCGAAIRTGHVIIRYQTSNNESRHWAECPDCGEVTDPQSHAQ